MRPAKSRPLIVATPRNDSYSAPSGGAIYGGMAAPDVLPAWLAAMTVGQWGAIANTGGAGGAHLVDAGGLARSGNRWIAAASGGQGGSPDNRVTAIDLSADVPAWSVLKPTSVVGAANIAYYSDGKPAARHTFHSIFSVAGNRVMLPGLRYAFGDGNTYDFVDAFDLATNQWVGVVADSPGTSGSGLANVTPSGFYPVAQDAGGDLWCVLHTTGDVAKYTVATNSWSQPAMAKVSPNVRYPWALDSTRNQLFGLAWGDGEEGGTGLRAVVLAGAAQTAISFSPGAALTQWLAEQPAYAAMDYDPLNDRFLFYSGRGAGAGRVYVITPNAGTTWSIAIQSGAGTLAGTNGTRLVRRLAYFPALKGFACMPDPNGNVYFLRLA